MWSPEVFILSVIQFSLGCSCCFYFQSALYFPVICYSFHRPRVLTDGKGFLSQSVNKSTRKTTPSSRVLENLVVPHLVVIFFSLELWRFSVCSQEHATGLCHKPVSLRSFSILSFYLYLCAKWSIYFSVRWSPRGADSSLAGHEIPALSLSLCFLC
jgi:hypothetical protein